MPFFRNIMNRFRRRRRNPAEPETITEITHGGSKVQGVPRSVTRKHFVTIRDFAGVERKVSITIFPTEIQKNIIERSEAAPVDVRRLRLSNEQIRRMKEAFKRRQ